MQAFCSLYSLAVAAKTVWLTYIVMFMTSPLALPIGYLLDLALGKEVRYLYNQDRVRELGQLLKKEEDIITEQVFILLS